MFFKKKKSAPDIWSCTVPHTKGFRGFKRLRLATYADRDSEIGCKRIAKLPFFDQVRFVEIPGYDGINVFVDDFKAGTVWAHSWPDYYKAIRSEKVAKVHLMVENGPYLFLSFKD